MNPRGIDSECIEKACDLVINHWIVRMRVLKTNMQERNVAEWVASAAKNARIIYDQCDAPELIQAVLEAVGFLTPGPPEDDFERAYNEAIWMAVTHQDGALLREKEVKKFLKRRFAMNGGEINRFVRVLSRAPADGLERSCRRMIEFLPDDISSGNVDGTSRLETFDKECKDLIPVVRQMPPEEVEVLAAMSLRLLQEGDDQGTA